MINRSIYKRFGLGSLFRLGTAVLALHGALFVATHGVSLRAQEILAHPNPPAAAQFEDEGSKPISLVVGEPLDRDLAKGESHSYRIPLKAGQYINLLVQPRAIDVKATMLDPAGKVIAESDWEGEGAAESLWTLVEATGDYEIRVTATARSWSDPRYLIKVEKVADLEAAPAADATYLKAYQAVWKAQQLRLQGTNESMRDAAKSYENGIALFRELNDQIAEAITFMEAGRLYIDTNEREKGLASYTQALQIWRSVKSHRTQEAKTLYQLGAINASLGHNPESIAYYKASIEIWQALSDLEGQASALNDLGIVYYNLAEFQAAMGAMQQALHLRQAIGDIEGQARSLSNISAIYSSLGEFQEALNYCKQALPLRRAAKDRRGEQITLTNIGTNYRELGEPQTALEYYQQALLLVDPRHVRPEQASLLDRMGRAYYDLGDYSKALEVHQQSLSARRSSSDQFEEATLLADIGNDYARLGERQKALEYFDQVLKLYRDMGAQRGQALALQYAGETYRELGEISKALAYLNEGLALSRAIKNKFFEANFLYAIARTEADASRIEEALRDVEAAIDLIESTRAKVMRIDVRASLLASKQDFYELEIDLLMQTYYRQGSQESLARAFNISERRRARSLLDDLEESGANIREGINPDLLARERSLATKLNRAAESQIRIVSANHSAEDATALSQQVDAAAGDYEQVLAEIRAASPHYAALTQPETLSLSQVQQKVLDQNTILLEYTLGRERSYLWAVTRDQVSAFQLPPRTRIESLAHQVYDLMTARNRFLKFERNEARQVRIAKADSDYQKAARELSRVLFPASVMQSHQQRLLIVADGALQYLPFAALSFPDHSGRESESAVYVPLITKYEVINLASASTLAVLRSELAQRKPAPKTIAVIADPVFDKNDERVSGRSQSAKPPGQPMISNAKDDDRLTRAFRDFAATEDATLLPLRRLRFTREEADAIISLTSPGTRKEATDFNANLATVLDPQLSEYRYLHFATHGLLNNRHPELSGIVLSLVDERGHDQNGFLLASDIYNLNFPAELVVLSGCKTGLGKEIKGEGILSLTRSFMYAGAARVMVSLWDVNDKSTAELMTQFYQAALGKDRLSPAAALRNAQVAMWKSGRWRAPYYWAAFVLQGEYP